MASRRHLAGNPSAKGWMFLTGRGGRPKRNRKAHWGNGQMRFLIPPLFQLLLGPACRRFSRFFFPAALRRTGLAKKGAGGQESADTKGSRHARSVGVVATLGSRGNNPQGRGEARDHDSGYPAVAGEEEQDDLVGRHLPRQPGLERAAPRADQTAAAAPLELLATAARRTGHDSPGFRRKKGLARRGLDDVARR